MAKADVLYFEIHHWVATLAENWTEADAEIRLNALRRATRKMVRGNQANKPQWMTLAFDGRSTAAAIRVESGKVYLHEGFALRAVVGADADPQLVQDAILVLMKAAFAELSQGIYGYMRDAEDFGAESPVSYVASAGADFSGALTFGG